MYEKSQKWRNGKAEHTRYLTCTPPEVPLRRRKNLPEGETAIRGHTNSEKKAMANWSDKPPVVRRKKDLKEEGGPACAYQKKTNNVMNTTEGRERLNPTQKKGRQKRFNREKGGKMETDGSVKWGEGASREFGRRS